MESPYVLWAWIKGLRHFSEEEVAKLKQYFSSSSNGGGEIHSFEQEESPEGLLLRIEYKDDIVAGQVIERNHELALIVGPYSDKMKVGSTALVLSKRKPDRHSCEVSSTTANQIVESDEENMQSYEVLDEVNPSSAMIATEQNLLSKLEVTEKVKGDVFSTGKQSKAVVEVYEFPNKPVDELLEELTYHFSIDPFNAITFTSHEDMYDGSSKTFKLEFYGADAENILKNEVHYLLGEESEKIKLRLFKPQKPCAVLLTCEVKLASEKLIRTVLTKFGEVKEVRKMDDSARKYLAIFLEHEAAIKASNARGVDIAGKQVTLSLWNEPVDISIPAATPSVLSTSEVPELKANKVLVSCETKTTLKVVEVAMKTFGSLTKCTQCEGANTFLVEFANWSDAHKVAAERNFTSGSKTFNVKLYEDKSLNTDLYKSAHETVNELERKASKGMIGEEKSSKTDDCINPKEQPQSKKVTENSNLLVSIPSDVDNQLLAHWLKTVTGIWPLSCHFNDTKDKAIVKMPSIIDTSLFSKANEEEFYLHGSPLTLSMLPPATKILAEFNKEVHQDAVRLYFSSSECGLKSGQLTSIKCLDNQTAFIVAYDEPKAIEEVTQRVNHNFMGSKIEVGEYNPAAGYCKPRDRFVFPSRKCKVLPDEKVARLVVKNVSSSDRQHFELLMKNKRSGGEKSAKFSYSGNLAYVSYNGPEVTNAVFEVSRKDGIYLNDKRLEIDLETTELTSIHDHKAVRLSGLPRDMDPDRLKFYVSDISENFVTSMLFQENGDRAVVYFKNNLDMQLISSNYRSIKLEGCEEIRIQPELKSTSIMVSTLDSKISQNYLELLIDDFCNHPHSVKVEQSKDVESAWIVSVFHEDMQLLKKELSKVKDMKVSNYSEFLGARVTYGIHRKCLLLSDLVKDPSLLKFLLDNQLSGYKKLSNLIQDYGCEFSTNGEITMNFDAQIYRACTKKWEGLKDVLAKEVIHSWSVNKSITLPKEVTDELSQLLSSSKTKVKIITQEENLIIAGENKNVQETVSELSRVIKLMEERKIEERETRKEVLSLKDYEAAYLNIINCLSDLKRKYSIKELVLDTSKGCLIIHANNKYIDNIKKEITEITSSLCEASVKKSDLFLKKCESDFAREKILDLLKLRNLLAVVVPGQKKLTAYARTKETVHMALRCIEEVVWEVTYPDGRTFCEEERKFLLQSKHLWEKAKNAIKKDSSVDIIETIDDANFVVIGCGKGNQIPVLKGIDEFFNRSLPRSLTFAGNPFHVNYMIRYYLNSEIKIIQQSTKAIISCNKDEVTLSGTTEETRKAELKLRELHDKIISAKHKVEVDYHIQLLLSERDIIEDVGNSCQTLIILENEAKLRQLAPEPSKAQTSLVLKMYISPRTTLQVKNAEIHEILDCDGLAIPTSRTLTLSDLNGTFAKYIREKGGNEIFKECMNSPKAIKAGRTLLPGSILTTSAGEFRELKKIIHMVLVDWSQELAINVLEKGLKGAFKSAKELGIMALLIPMSSFPEDSNYDMVVRALITTIKAMEDELPPRIVLLETETEKINDLKSSLSEDFPCERNDPELGLRMPSPASTSAIGFQTVNDELKKLSSTQLLIGRCKFTVIKGLLQESKQQAVVNSTGVNISLQENPLARALSDTAGPELQKECDSLTPLNPGEVKVSKAYGLKCKNVLHCRINGHYNDSQSEKDLTSLIIECLRVVDQTLNHQSIAFPALGTGILRYPASVVASCLIDGLKEYTSKNAVKHLSEVVVVIFPADSKTYEGFLDALGKCIDPNQNKATPIRRNEGGQIKQKESKESLKKTMSSEAFLNVNNTVIAVHQGDILQYDGKAIVCPTNKQLALGGAVAEKLMKDSHIKKEIAKADVKEMSSDGVCLVKTSLNKVKIPNYKAEYVFLIDADSQLDTIVKTCLQKCQKKKIGSIALPFIGSGVGNRGAPAEIAKKLLSAAIEFVGSNGDGTLKKIDFIIYGPMPFEIFERALHELKEQPSFLGRIKGVIKSFTDSWFEPYNSEGSNAQATSNAENEDCKILHMTIYAMDEADIQLTKKKLDARLEKETVVIQWDQTDGYKSDKLLIADLSAEQVATLNSLAKKMGVDFIIDQDLMNIQITGYKSTIYDFRDAIKNELRNIEACNLAKKVQEFQSSKVQWAFCKEKDEKWNDFHWEDSLLLESVFKANPNAVQRLDSKTFKECLKVDLHEKSFKLSGDRYIVRRIDQTAGFPEGWDESAGPLAEVTLDKASKEYKAVEANFKATINDPNAAILEVKRVQHLTAYNQYLEQRRFVANKLKRSEDQVERVPLWHGSQEDTISKIAKSFFNRSYSGLNATVYGKGSYFARDASYSADDRYSKPNSFGEKYMFQARVVVGDFMVGNHTMQYCPNKQDGTPCDSLVENLQNPTIFVVFHDAAAYPEYIIKFRR